MCDNDNVAFVLTYKIVLLFFYELRFANPPPPTNRRAYTYIEIFAYYTYFFFFFYYPVARIIFLRTSRGP